MDIPALGSDVINPEMSYEAAVGQKIFMELEEFNIGYAYRSLNLDNQDCVNQLVGEWQLIFLKIQQRKVKGLASIPKLHQLLEEKKQQIEALIMFQ